MKKYLKLIACFALVAAISVGATLAYLQTTMDPKENKFISSQKINGTLEEPNWTGGDKPIAEGEAWNYLPGESHGKDPKISITSDSVDAYVAIKLDFSDESGSISYETFKTKYAKLYSGKGTDVEFKDDWDEVQDQSLGNSKLFVYKKVRSYANGEAATSTLFDRVDVNKEVEAVGGKLPSFQINVTGYAVQAEQVTQSEAIAELVKMATTTKN